MYDIEKQSLEAHVELCAERYRALEQRLDAVDTRMDRLTSMLEDIQDKLASLTDRHVSKWDQTQLAVIAVMATIIGALVARYVL